MVKELDMAREMARLIESGKSSDELAAEIRRMFQAATAADFQRGDASSAEIDAAIARTKISAGTLFPKPDKTKS